MVGKERRTRARIAGIRERFEMEATEPEGLGGMYSSDGGGGGAMYKICTHDSVSELRTENNSCIRYIDLFSPPLPHYPFPHAPSGLIILPFSLFGFCRLHAAEEADHVENRAETEPPVQEHFSANHHGRGLAVHQVLIQ